MPDREIYLDDSSVGLRALRDGVATLRGLSRVCFFVHGYNVSPREAKNAFDELVKTIRRETHIADEVTVPSLDGAEGWRVYWPAYGRLGRDRWTLSALTYPWHVADIEEWAAAFATYLTNELKSADGVPVRITFVAHSLGCRLILEVLRNKLFNKPKNWSVQCLFLMAAAVPVHLVDYDERLCRAALDPATSHVAYSPLDTVLQGPFRVGQMLEGGFLPTAVGSWGQPVALWNKRIATRNGHGSYFRDPLTARHLGAALGLRVMREPERRDVARHPIAARTITTSSPPLDRRPIKGRRIGS